METSPFDDHVLLLTSSDVTERRKAVIGLGNSGDSRALTILAIVYEHDPDSALRALAFKAGRHIKGHTGPLTGTAKPQKGPDSESVSPFTSIETEADLPAAMAVYRRNIAIAPMPNRVTGAPSLAPLPASPAFSDSAMAKRKPVSDRQATLAKGRLESAIGLASRGENDKALSLLIEAVRTNPDLQTTVIARNLASTLIGIQSPIEAMNMVVNRAEFPPPGKGNIAIAGAMRPSNSILVDPALLTLVLMIVALSIILTLFYVTLKFGLLNFFQALGGSFRGNATQAGDIQQATQALKDLTFGTLLKGGLLWTFNILLDTCILYAVGVFMGGSGLVLPFLTRLLRVQAVVYTLIVLSLAILTFGVYRAIPATSAARLAVLSTVLAALAYLGGTLWKGFAVGRNHNLGFFKGLGVVFVASIVSGVLAVVLGSFA